MGALSAFSTCIFKYGFLSGYSAHAGFDTGRHFLGRDPEDIIAQKKQGLALMNNR
jgi:hypothetical protein